MNWLTKAVASSKNVWHCPGCGKARGGESMDGTARWTEFCGCEYAFQEREGRFKDTKDMRIAELEAENARLRDLLYPFVDGIAREWTEANPDEGDDERFIVEGGMSMGDLRRAVNEFKDNPRRE